MRRHAQYFAIGFVVCLCAIVAMSILTALWWMVTQFVAPTTLALTGSSILGVYLLGRYVQEVR